MSHPKVQQLRIEKDQETHLIRWLDKHLQDIEDRRSARAREWIKWRTLYEGKTTPKDFPWTGASNVFVPQVGIAVDQIHANMMNRLFGAERIWDVFATRPTEQIGTDPTSNQPITWGDAARSLQNWLKIQVDPGGSIDIYHPTEDAILECIKIGTSILYNPYVMEVSEDFVLDHTTGTVSKEDTVLFDGVRPQVIPLEDFEVVPNYPEITGPNAAFLFGHRYYLRRGQLVGFAQQGLFRQGGRVKEVFKLPGEEDPDYVKDEATRVEGEPEAYTDTKSGDYLLRDLVIRYAFSDDQPEMSLFVTYHKKSGTILRLHPWLSKAVQYHPMRYLRREGRFYGIGIPELLETMQSGLNTTFNQSVDNATIANVRAVKVKAGSPLATRFGELYPGRRFVVNQMDELEPFQLGEVYPSIFQIGLLFRDFMERRSGISDRDLGRDQADGTATTTLALIQESSRRFDLYAKDIRRAISALGTQTLILLQEQRRVEGMFATLGADEGSKAAALITQPSFEDLREHIRIVVTTAASASNKEVARQAAVTAFGLVSQYLEKLFTLAPVIANPEVPPGLRKMAYDMSQTAERLMQRVLEGFDLPELAEFLPQLEGLLNDSNGNDQTAPGGPPQLGASPGGSQGPQGLFDAAIANDGQRPPGVGNA